MHKVAGNRVKNSLTIHSFLIKYKSFRNICRPKIKYLCDKLAMEKKEDVKNVFDLFIKLKKNAEITHTGKKVKKNIYL